MTSFDLGSEIKNMIGDLQRNDPVLSASARVKKAWNTSVDQRIRDHVTAVFVVPNTDAREVVVYVDSNIWATELNLQVEVLKLKLNMELAKIAPFYSNDPQQGQVESLKFVLSKETYTSRQNQKSTAELLHEEEEGYRNVVPIDLSDDEMADLQEVAAKMENDTLRDIIYSAAKVNLEWQKGLKQAI